MDVIVQFKMNKTDSIIWEMDPHTEAKHEILKKYLQAWLPIISRYHGRVVYIDGFAGPGEYVGRKDGSPVIAIKEVGGHKLRAQMKAEFKFLFIEKEQDRCEYLKQVLSKLQIPSDSKVEFTVECGRFDDVVGGLLDKFEKENTKLAPTFVFIDPFGFSGAPLDLIKRIMANKSCEVLITFMYEDIVRWASLPENAKHLDSLFGSNDWKAIIEDSKLDAQERLFRLHNLYQSQLEKKAKIQFVHSFMMVNKNNKPDYFLFFGTNHLLGLEKMKEAMWRVDKSGSFQFSDATYDPKQAVLFEPTPNYVRLKKDILAEYKSKKVKIEDLEIFVVTKTAFLRTHIRKNVLDRMDSTASPEIKVSCSKKRSRGTYPPGTNIEFL